MYEKHSVLRSVKLICCDAVDEEAALAPLQEMSALLRRYESYAFERIIAEIMSTRLLRRTAQNKDYWDVYNDTPELNDQRGFRTIFIRSNSIPSQWDVFVWGGIISEKARSVLESWFRGPALIMPRDEDDNLAVAAYTDLARASMILQMNVLMTFAEQKLVHHTSFSIAFKNWWNGLQVTEKAGRKHAHHKRLSEADSVCARIRLRHETLRVQKLEKSSSAVDMLFD
ncbi:hypothetical protein FGB62_115g011 [Gracilaria domingensis]|nr:hypothetical protein FGB62_115g011 [Gracilaria domingensis]